MIVFCVGGSKEVLEASEEIFINLLGLTKIVKKTDNIWILCFENKESAIAARWQLGVIGAEGVE